MVWTELKVSEIGAPDRTARILFFSIGRTRRMCRSSRGDGGGFFFQARRLKGFRREGSGFGFSFTSVFAALLAPSSFFSRLIRTEGIMDSATVEAVRGHNGCDGRWGPFTAGSLETTGIIGNEYRILWYCLRGTSICVINCFSSSWPVLLAGSLLRGQSGCFNGNWLLRVVWRGSLSDCLTRWLSPYRAKNINSEN